MDRSLVSGVAWTASAKWATQVLTWLSTIVVARLLTPADYGLVAMAQIFIGLANLLSEFGLGAAVVRFRNLSHSQIRQINSLSVVLGALAFGTSIVVAPYLGRFFGAPDLPLVVGVMGSSFLLTGFRVVPMAVLRRDLQFRSLALIDTSQALAASALTLVLALLGLGYWSLVLGNLVGAAVSTAGPIYLRPRGFHLPRLGALREPITFSEHVIGSRLAWYVYVNADFLIVGRFVGQAALGAYQLAWSFATLPVVKITAMLMRVTDGVFSAVQDEPAELRRYLVRITEAIALVTVPASVGLAVVADDLLIGLLGEKWAGGVMPLRILGLFVAFRSVTPLLPQVLNVIGASRVSMWHSFGLALLLPPAFLFGSEWGTTGVAAAWVAVYPVAMIPLYVILFRRIELRPWSYLAALWIPVYTSGVMAAALVGLRMTVLSGIDRVPRLFVEVACGAAVYALLLWIFHRTRITAFRQFMSNMRSKKGP